MTKEEALIETKRRFPKGSRIKSISSDDNYSWIVGDLHYQTTNLISHNGIPWLYDDDKKEWNKDIILITEDKPKELSIFN